MTRPRHVLHLLYKGNILLVYVNRKNIDVKNIFWFLFYVWPAGCILRMFHISCFWLFVSGQVDKLITYLRAMGYQDLRHWYLKSNTIVWIRPFRMTQYNLYWLLEYIDLSIACVSGADILDDFGISFLHLCVSCMCVGYILCPFLMVLHC